MRKESKDKLDQLLFEKKFKRGFFISIPILFVITFLIIFFPVSTTLHQGQVLTRPTSSDWSLLSIIPTRHSIKNPSLYRPSNKFTCRVKIPVGLTISAICSQYQQYGIGSPTVNVIYHKRLIPYFNSYYVQPH